MKKVVCIAGKARSGKDSTAFFIKQHLEALGKSAIIVHYADFLKYVCKHYFDWDGKKDANGRTLLQSVGERAREFNSYFWVRTLKEIIEYTLPQYDYILIADVRYPEEIEYWIEDYDYEVFCIRVVRDAVNDLTPEQKNHPSEVSLDDYDEVFNYRVENNSSLESLYYMTEMLVKDMEENIRERVYRWI